LRPKSVLLLPPRQLSSCIATAIFRDTRGALLSDTERYNHFPASPLVSVTYVITGHRRLMPQNGALDFVGFGQALPRQTVMPPQDKPITSWSPGPVAAVTVGVFPDAWAKLTQNAAAGAMQLALANAFGALDQADDVAACWVTFCDSIALDWRNVRAAGGLNDWEGSYFLADWSRSLLGRALLAGHGRSIRAMERRLKRWGGQTRRSMNFYVALENLHRRSIESTDAPLAAIAADAGFADQSHMGRAVRRATGYSPARLNYLIETEEAFWCYRLLGERF
jgi:AraC-like DNA-binding protein